MIGRKSKSTEVEPIDAPRGFDDFELQLGDVMRGERATMGKSLLDVQRELRIKASYIAAIENCDPDAFETPGFIPGYVRSYARYLDMDPDATFELFCAESGFVNAHGMQDSSSRSDRDASKARADGGGKAVFSPVFSRTRGAGLRGAAANDGSATGQARGPRDPFLNPSLPFRPADDGVFSNLEPGAVGSVAVLVALIGALGYGGWSVLLEVQRVQLAPVEQTPIVLSELDPLSAASVTSAVGDARTAGEALAGNGASSADQGGVSGAGVFTPPNADGLDRLYRPRALDVPVLVARDAPISSLDPNRYGAFAETAPSLTIAEQSTPPVDDLLGDPALAVTGVQVVAVRPAWVRVRDNGQVLFAGVMNAGDTWNVPGTAVDPSIEVGESGAVYFAVNGKTFGPTGPRGEVTSDLALQGEVLAAILPEADRQSDVDLNRVLADLGNNPTASSPVPQVFDTTDKRVTVVASRTAWVRVRSAAGTVLYEGVMEAGDVYTAPATETPPTIRTGDAGAIYFAAAGKTYGPYGRSGAIQDNLALSVETITESFSVADIASDGPVARAVAQVMTLSATSDR